MQTMKIATPRILILLSAIVFLSGCAHQRLSDSANTNLQQGRYELALEDYNQALALKPNNRQNLEGQRQARQNLDLWLDTVHRAADRAYGNQEKGKALLLYAKIVQLRKVPQAIERYQSLLEDITQAQQLPLNASGNPQTFGPHFASSIPGLKLQSQSYAGESYAFSVANYQSKTLLDEELVSQRYLVGVETLANPDFLYRQDAIHEGKSSLRALKHDLKGLQHRQKKLKKSHDSIQSRIQQLETSIASLTPGTKPYQRVSASIEREKNNRKKLNRKIAETAERIEHNRHERHRYSKALDHDYEALSFLPPTIEQDVFADYEYTVAYLTQTMNVDLLVRSRGKTEEIKVVYSHTDSDHEAHPTINLAAKEAFSETQEQMRAGADREALKSAENYLRDKVSEHRHQIKVAASNASNPARRLESWIAYLLAGDQSQDPQVERDIRQHLELELGHAGELSIAQLLSLYRS